MNLPEVSGWAGVRMKERTNSLYSSVYESVGLKTKCNAVVSNMPKRKNVLFSLGPSFTPVSYLVAVEASNPHYVM